MNDALQVFPEPTRGHLLRRLEATANFLATYNELAVTEIFRRSGYEFTYEPDLAGRTPDLVLPARDGRPMVLVEVATRFRSDRQRQVERSWAELKSRVDQIPVPVGIYVRGPGGTPPNPPDSATAKRLATALRERLTSTTPVPLNQAIAVENYLFVVAVPAPGSRVMLATPASAGAYDSDLVLDAIGEKITRYARIADEAEAALVVVLAAELQSPLTLELLRTALRGTQSISITMDMFSSNPVTTRRLPMRERDALATFHPAVSAVCWLAAGVEEPGTLTVFPVATAGRPVEFRESRALLFEQLRYATGGPRHDRGDMALQHSGA